MNAQLKHIEVVLAQAKAQAKLQTPASGPSRGAAPARSGLGSCSFELEGRAASKPSGISFEAFQPAGVGQPATTSGQSERSPLAGAASSASVEPGGGPEPRSRSFTAETVSPFATGVALEDQEPALPRMKQVKFSTHRNSTNPAFALSLLHDVAQVVEQWQQRLEMTHQQIHSLYAEGAIVDGWLESEVGPQGQTRGYRLCGLDQHGQVWRRPCAPEQLPSLSLAIARYQKLRQLLAQKKGLEVRLHRLVKTLTVLRGQLQN